MEEQVKKLLELLKKERRVITLHYLPAENPDKNNDYGGIQWGSNTSSDFVEEFNSYPKEVQLEAEKEFVSYIVTKAMQG